MLDAALKRRSSTVRAAFGGNEHKSVGLPAKSRFLGRRRVRSGSLGMTKLLDSQ
jgi:hypothetical protein